MSIQKADKQMEITCVSDTQVMNVQEVIDYHEERIAATPQSPTSNQLLLIGIVSVHVLTCNLN